MFHYEIFFLLSVIQSMNLEFFFSFFHVWFHFYFLFVYCIFVDKKKILVFIWWWTNSHLENEREREVNEFESRNHQVMSSVMVYMLIINIASSLIWKKNYFHFYPYNCPSGKANKWMYEWMDNLDFFMCG